MVSLRQDFDGQIAYLDNADVIAEVDAVQSNNKESVTMAFVAFHKSIKMSRGELSPHGKGCVFENLDAVIIHRLIKNPLVP